MKLNILAVFVVSLLLITGCATQTISSENSGYVMNKTEQEALGSGIVQLFSEGLPNYAYDASFLISQNKTLTIDQILISINKYGSVKQKDIDANSPTIIGRVGSGTMNLNPAGIIVVLSKQNEGTKISIRAVAKEGLVKQNTCGKAVERLISDVEKASGKKVMKL